MTLTRTSVKIHFVAMSVAFFRTNTFPKHDILSKSRRDQIVKDAGDDPRGTHASPSIVSTTVVMR